MNEDYLSGHWRNHFYDDGVNDDCDTSVTTGRGLRRRPDDSSHSEYYAKMPGAGFARSRSIHGMPIATASNGSRTISSKILRLTSQAEPLLFPKQRPQQLQLGSSPGDHCSSLSNVESRFQHFVYRQRTASNQENERLRADTIILTRVRSSQDALVGDDNAPSSSSSSSSSSSRTSLTEKLRHRQDSGHNTGSSSDRNDATFPRHPPSSLGSLQSLRDQLSAVSQKIPVYDREPDTHSSKRRQSFGGDSAAANQTSAPATIRGRKALVVYCIRDGTCQKLHFTTSELLRLVHSNQEGNGGLETRSQHVSGTLKLRDLRQICYAGVGSQRPSIEPRRNCILINMPHVKALILTDRIYLIDRTHGEDASPPAERCVVKKMAAKHCPVPDEGHQDHLEIVLGRECDKKESKGSSRASPKDNLSFLTEPLIKPSSSYQRLAGRFRRLESATTPVQSTVSAVVRKCKSKSREECQSLSLIRKLMKLSEIRFLTLETILFEVITRMNDAIEPVHHTTVEQFRIQQNNALSSTEKLHQIRDLKRFLQDAENIAEGVANSLSEILQTEEDIRRLEISRFWKRPHEWDEPADSPGAEDAEILLESYQQDIESILQKIKSTDETLDTLLQIMQLHLATTRNVLLKFEIGCKCDSRTCSCNSRHMGNGYENDTPLFWNIAKIMAAVICGTCIIVLLFTVKLKL